MIAWTMLVLLALGGRSKEQQPSAETIIQRSVEANQTDWQAFPKYDFDERDSDPDGDSRSYRVMMILGSPYSKLIAVNGKPLSRQRQAQEERKLQKAIRIRRNETGPERARRVGAYEKDRARDHLLMEQLTIAFDFTVIGQERLGPYDVYVLKATRRDDYNPPNRDSQVLTGMEGKLWIDKKTFQWVKVEAHVVEPVSIEGFLARVEPGTRFELEKMPVGDGTVWVRKHFEMQSRAKVLFLFNHSDYENETYSNYELGESGHAVPAR